MKILALDQGTTSSRAIIFDEKGVALGKGQVEFSQHFPQPGWVEHDPEEIWFSQKGAIEKALKDCGCSIEDITTIGITNQRETTVMWDKQTGKALRNAIVWQDRRCAAFCQKHKKEKEPWIKQKTGLCLDPYFSGTKISWMIKHNPEAQDLISRNRLAFGTIETWLIWKLTEGKVHVTDISNASRTMLMNLETQKWDLELLEWLEITPCVLPEICSSSELIGEATALGASTPISGMIGDQQAALFGQLCTEPGMVKNTYGTGCFLLMNTGAEIIHSKDHLLTTVAWKIGNKTNYALEGSVFTAGAIVKWLKEGLGIIESNEHLTELISETQDNGGIYFAPALTGLGTPHWDPFARGLIGGITRGTTAAHIARAALESIAFQVNDLVKAMNKSSDLPISEIRVDGGVSVSDFLMQLQSDLLDCDIVRTDTAETTARGAAFLAGLGVGVWKDIEEVKQLWKETDRFSPAPKLQELDQLQKGWNAAVTRSLNWAAEVQ